MATLKAVVDHRKADGTYRIKIRLTHNRKTLYIPTSLFVTDRHLTRSKAIKDHAYLMAANRIIEDMRKRMLDIPYIERMSAEELRKAITIDEKNFRLDFFEYSYNKMKKMKYGTANAHLVALNQLKKFRNKIDVNDLTYRFIADFKTFLESQKLHNNSISMYLAKIKHLLNLAKDEYNDDNVINIKVNPFKAGVIPPMQKTEHRTLTTEQIRRMADIQGDRYENYVRDVFLLSFCLIGINMIDIYNLKKDALDGDFLTYCRIKTKDRRQDRAKITIRVEPEAKRLMSVCLDSDSDYLFFFRRRYASEKTMQIVHNEIIKRLRNYDPTLPAGLTYYYARHTWATIAYNECGIDMQTIHEALNHASDASMKITDVYVKKDFTRIWEANRKVLDYVFGSDNK